MTVLLLVVACYVILLSQVGETLPHHVLLMATMVLRHHQTWAHIPLGDPTLLTTTLHTYCLLLPLLDMVCIVVQS